MPLSSSPATPPEPPAAITVYGGPFRLMSLNLSLANHVPLVKPVDFLFRIADFQPANDSLFMRVVIGGVRGSFPVAQAGFTRYGGETTSVLVEGVGGERVLLDLGTGARRLGARLHAQGVRDLLVLLTHFHLDHLIGLPSLSLLNDPGCRIEFATPGRRGLSIERELSRLLDQPLWPLQLDTMAARLRFRHLPGAVSSRPIRRGGLEIRWAPLHHPSGCSAYRLDEPATGAAMVFATDVEWPLASAAEREAFLAWATTPRPPSALFFDGQFTPADYPRYRSWGHSRWSDAVEVAQAVGARRLFIIHHAPDRDDRALAAIEQRLRAAYPSARAARQGMIIRF